MSYWCKYLSEIDSGQSIELKINNKKYFFFIKDNNFGVKNINFNQISISTLIEKDFNDNFEAQLLKYENIKNIYFALQPILSYDLNFTKSIFLLQSKNYNHLVDFSLIINLNNNEITLFNNLRQNYKSTIKKEEKKIKVRLINNENIEYSNNIFEDWITIYSDAIKKADKTISKDAVKFLKLAIKNKEAIIFNAYEKNSIVGGVLFNMINNIPSYSSAVTIPLENKNNQRYINHFLIWKSILYFKNNDYKILEIDTSCSLNNKNSKQKNISFFKRGFGAVLYPQHFFSKTITTK